MDDAMSDVEIVQRLRDAVAATPFCQIAGAQVGACRAGYAEIIVPFRPELTQHHGFLHGAVVAFIADSACAWAAATVGGDVLTAQLNLHIAAPGVGERFIGRGRVLKATRRQIVASAEVFAVANDDEKLIAFASSTVLRVAAS